MLEVRSKEDFEGILSSGKGLFLTVFYTESSAKSVKALDVLENFANSNKGVTVCSVDAGKVADIHGVYGINSVPAVLVFKDRRKINVIYGLQTKEYYDALFMDYGASGSEGAKKTNRIVVYTSDGCPWCNRAKSYLREQKQVFREVNVSRKPAEADRLVKKTGQTGTPQININGSFVVGFNQARIDSLLGIR
ncbi:MAG: thioredoxin family protein [Elusimicrobiota bacterium]|nr:thioredoxin family protein [Elusimicrobiota bacterium]